MIQVSPQRFSLSKITSMRAHRTNHQRGVALVLVLVFLVLITGLIVAYFMSVTTELKSSKSYADEGAVRQLADSAVSAVIGQIRDATSQSSMAWASQPGMIRLFDNTGKPSAYYKLYSSDHLVVTADQIQGGYTLSGDLAADWDKYPALYTDLNRPVLAADPGDPTNTLKPVFPIVDPRAVDNAVEGFSYTAGVNGVVDTSGDTRRLPMPVRWIYFLRDGKLSSPTTADATTASWTGTDDFVPTASNPIVGRIAFWTDDDSSKVNVNTASEGTYWDTPISNANPDSTKMALSTGTPTGTGDSQLSAYQGAQKEYQRYPGHPATTSLSPIFGNSLAALTRADLVEGITKLTPRVIDGVGSTRGGTITADTNTPLVPDSDRLYASTDEFVFGLDAKLAQRPEQKISTVNIRDTIEKAMFFITAHSRAPEENLFGKPRVAMWPITKSIGKIDDPSDQTKMTAFDKLIARASTIPGTASKVYYFTRQDPKSQTADWGPRNQALYTYLQSVTTNAVPGFGGNFATKFPVPSGATVSDRNQILTEIFDYIRCTNISDISEDGTLPTTYQSSYSGKSYTNPTQDSNGATNRGWVLPIKPSGPATGTRGFGRIETISQLALIMIPVPPVMPTGSATGTVNGKTFDPKAQTLVEINLVPELFCPMAGFPALSENLKVRFTNIQLPVNGGAANFGPMPWDQLRSTDTEKGRFSDGANGASKIGGNMGIGSLSEVQSGVIGTPADSVQPNTEVLVTGVNPATFTVGPGTVTAQIIAPANSANVIQTITFTIPQMTVPIPKYSWSGTTLNDTGELAKGGPGSKVKGWRLNLNTLQDYIQGSNTFLTALDTVRSLVPVGGANADMRLIAGRETVDKINGTDVFQLLTPAPSTVSAYHALNGNCWRSIRGNTANRPKFQFPNSAAPGNLVKDVSYFTGNGQTPWRIVPSIPGNPTSAAGVNAQNGINGVPNSANQPGDWDNGPGLTPDGAYLNKADEGTPPPYLSSDVWTFNTVTALQKAGLFSPNRQVSSPVMLGSLPSGMMAGKPWQTLLFRPSGLVSTFTGAAYSHPDSTTSPPDHLLLDLFWMPVVEPYAISEPFSTAGKINLNYQLAPFTYIKRDTGMRAVLKSVMLTTLNPNDDGGAGWFGFSLPFKLSQGYKLTANAAPTATRRAIDASLTLQQFDERFSRSTYSSTSPNFFVSASEICDVPLVPVDSTDGNKNAVNAGVVHGDTVAQIATKMRTFWLGNKITGDNSLERPYSYIYPRVTTKSNTYTVHVKVQCLKKLAMDKDQNIWKEGRDQILGEFRGSYEIERYLDPDTAGFYKNGDVKQPSTETDPEAILAPYRYRVISSKQFGQ